MIELYNRDCLEAMREFEDGAFDLAIVDPPYGIGAGSKKFQNGSSKNKKNYFREKDWDIAPTKDYFSELMRVSKNQIVWGGNYFIDYLHSTRGMIFWDKTIHGNSYADGELAWTSFDCNIRYFRKNIVSVTVDGRIHPTQKPVALYTWLLDNYANEGDKILDTHLGSGSIAIACHNLGFDLVGFELDEDYFDAASQRLAEHQKQLRLF